MEKLDLTKLPIGTEVWSPLFGEGQLYKVQKDEKYEIIIKVGHSHLKFTRDGRYLTFEEGRCLLFPSKENQSWEGYFNTPIPDKALVWCSDDPYEFERILRFYDAKNKCTFYSRTGERNGGKFDHYELFEGEYPKWAKEAQKKLIDID